MRSIRSKISLVTTLAIVVSIILVGGLGIMFIKNEGEQESDREMLLRCDNVRKTLNNYMQSIEQTVDMVTRYVTEDLDNLKLMRGGVIGANGYGDAMEGRDWESDQQAELDAYLSQLEDKVEAVFRSAANYTYGVVAYYYRLNPEITERNPGFLFTKIDTASFTSHKLTDIFSYPLDDVSHVGWYSTPLQKGQSVWMAPYYNANLEYKMLSYVAPIIKAGTFIGVVGMDIGYETLVSQVAGIKIYETGYACLLDEEGNVVYHPTKEPGFRVESILPAITEAINNPEKNENGVTVFRYRYDGMEKKAVTAMLQNGLRLMIMAPAVEINENWYEMIKTFLFIGGAILIVFIAVTMLTTQRIIDPLQKLTAASQRLAEGDYDVKLEYEGNDEVGILTSSFQHLVSHLKAYINDLNSKAYKDALTHVKNKGAFEMLIRKINDEIAADDGKTVEFAIVMFDCNFLKNMNDQYGHAHGDLYLKSGCMFICKVYTHSPIFRVGGDEFAALLQGKDYEERDTLWTQFDEMAEKVNAEAQNPWERVNISKGMAVYDPTRDNDVESVFDRADEEMYKEKIRMKAVRTN